MTSSRCGLRAVAVFALVVVGVGCQSAEDPVSHSTPENELVGSVSEPLVDVLTFDDVRRIEATVVPGGELVVSAALCRHSAPSPWARLVASTDNCRLLHWLPATPQDGANLDTGEITVEVNGASVLLMSANAAPPCYRATRDALPGVEAGDTIRVISTGGTDLAPFDLSLQVPAAPVVEAEMEGARFRAGRPWPISWSGLEARDLYVEVRGTLDGRDFVASCRGLAGASLDLPAEVTAQWDLAAGDPHVQVGVERTVVTSGLSPVAFVVNRFGYDGMARVRIEP